MAQLAVDYSLDRDSDVPLGTQLAWKLRAAVATGRLRRGDRLPAVRELAEGAGVNVNTARAVYARLAEQGLIVSEHGRGTFVAADPAEQSELRDLVLSAARDARARGVDPRELGALLYSEPAPPPRAPAEAEAEARRELREQIERLDLELARIEAELAELGALPAEAAEGAGRRRAAGPRVLSVAELERTRARLAERLAARRQLLDQARQPQERADDRRTSPAASAWPELLALRGT